MVKQIKNGFMPNRKVKKGRHKNRWFVLFPVRRFCKGLLSCRWGEFFN